MEFYNGSRRKIAAVDATDDARRFGAQGLLLKRGQLHRALRDEAIQRGIRIEHGKKLVGLDVAEEGAQHTHDRPRVVAHFANDFGDGTAASGDLLFGCDGLHSRTRQLILPDAPGPAYSRFVDCGGFAQPATAVPVTGKMQMTFGKRAFFGYLAKPDGEVCWFSNLAWPEEPSRGQLAAISEADWQQRLLTAHADDPEPIPTLIRSTPGALGRWGVYELPSLPTWHRGPICLVGDAAHAASPHMGQGASTALEDALVLARCLRDIPQPERAFAAYEGLRRERVEKIVAMARRNGQQKAITNPVSMFIRDLLLPLFIKLGTRSTDWLYGYRLDWDTPVHTGATVDSRRPKRSLMGAP
jgi:2-polyprenyl-6-methoxyphenol hydroxylase-like FAD-dependent oxidoreductase